MLTNEIKKEIKKIVDLEIKALKNSEQKKLVNTLKDDDQVRKYIVDIIRDSFGDLFKTMWMRRSTWEKEIGRK